MRVVHLTDYDLRGGAAKGVRTLHESLRRMGVDSHLVAATVERSGDGVHEVPPRGLMSDVEDVIVPPLFGATEGPFTLALFGRDVSSLLDELAPDVVNLHWIGRLLTPGQIGRIARRYQTWWTLRDMRPFTGGCHYSRGCVRYAERCGRCPAIERSGRYDITRWEHRRRGGPIGRLAGAIALSDWLRIRAERSSILAGTPVHVVPPGIDTAVFRPSDRAVARRQLGLAVASPLIGFVADQPWREARKGGHSLLGAIRELTERGHRVELAVTDRSNPPTDVVTHALGRLDRTTLQALYAACDVVAVPSLEEAFGKVALEAQACGTPVVTWESTGPAECIRHLESGYVARHGDAADFAEGLLWSIQGSERLRGACRSMALEVGTSEAEARRYLTLYDGDR